MELNENKPVMKPRESKSRCEKQVVTFVPVISVADARKIPATPHPGLSWQSLSRWRETQYRPFQSLPRFFGRTSELHAVRPNRERKPAPVVGLGRSSRSSDEAPEMRQHSRTSIRINSPLLNGSGARQMSGRTFERGRREVGHVWFQTSLQPINLG